MKGILKLSKNCGLPFFFAGLFFFFVSVIAYSDNLGERTYQTSCKSCHAPNLAKALRAPAAFDKRAWDARFKTAEYESRKNPKRYKSAMKYLLNHLKMGKGLMHHGGLCHESNALNQDCSDQAYVEAILYMSRH